MNMVKRFLCVALVFTGVCEVRFVSAAAPEWPYAVKKCTRDVAKRVAAKKAHLGIIPGDARLVAANGNVAAEEVILDQILLGRQNQPVPAPVIFQQPRPIAVPGASTVITQQPQDQKKCPARCLDCCVDCMEFCQSCVQGSVKIAQENPRLCAYGTAAVCCVCGSCLEAGSLVSTEIFSNGYYLCRDGAFLVGACTFGYAACCGKREEAKPDEGKQLVKALVTLAQAVKKADKED